MAITKKRFDQEVRRAYIRGYMAAVDIYEKGNRALSGELEDTILQEEFHSFCDSHVLCIGCKYYSSKQDCIALFARDFRKEYGNGTNK